MKDPSISFTSTELIATASETLTNGGYRQIVGRFADWDRPSSRLFEDEYNIVGVVVFSTCAELLRGWSDWQGSLVEVISQHVSKAESKSWDGYLALLTPALAPSERDALESIRYNTTRLRKLVATGEELHATSDVDRVLRALLPLESDRVEVSLGSAVELIPRLLATQGINEEVTKTLIEAFRKQLPLMEQLHNLQEEP